MHLSLKQIGFCGIIFLIVSFSGSLPSFGQGLVIDSLVRIEFKNKVDLMVSEMEMTDSVTTVFYEIYSEYGLYMKECYENRVGWLHLYEQYKWARRDRDGKLKLILDTYQFQCFLQHQKEIEQAARKNR